MPRDKAQAKGLIGNVVTAIDNLISAAIAADKPEREMDDMGTYYEELALDKALNEFVDMLIEEGEDE